MTHLQFREALETLGLSIVGSAKYFGLSKRQAQRIAAPTNPAPVPPLVATVLKLLLTGKIQLEDLFHAPEAKSPRKAAAAVRGGDQDPGT